MTTGSNFSECANLVVMVTHPLQSSRNILRFHVTSNDLRKSVSAMFGVPRGVKFIPWFACPGKVGVALEDMC